MRIWELFSENLSTFISALGVTVQVTIFSLLLACIIGIIFCLFKLSKNKILHALAAIYISIIRGTPLMVQILFIYFGLPMAFGFRWNLTIASIVIMSINAGAYMTELFRGGIESVDKGQMEAARSLGLSYAQAMRKVVLPQALRTMLPSIINQFIASLKDTSLLSVIGLRELTQNTRIIVANNMEALSMYFIVGVYYWVFVSVLTFIANQIEKRTKYGR